MSESNEERTIREEREKEDIEFTKAIDDSYKLVRNLALDNNALENYNRSESKLENLHLALVIMGEGRAINKIYRKVSEGTFVKAIVASLIVMAIASVVRLFIPSG